MCPVTPCTFRYLIHCSSSAQYHRILLQEDTEHRLGCVSQELPLVFPRQSQHSLGHTEPGDAEGKRRTCLRTIRALLA